MNFQELVAEVLIIVKRPDLTDRVQSAVRAATLKMHHSDFYYKDLKEFPVQFDAPRYIQNFLPTEITPQFRKIKYIRLWNGEADGAVGQFLTPIQIENSNDAYNYIKENVFYMAGQLLQIRTSCQLERVLTGMYVHPVITPETSYSSWIAVEYPYAIIYEAARSIFQSISFQEQANVYAGLTAEVLSEIRLSSIEEVPFT